MTEAWDSVQFDFDLEDATNSLKYSTEVEASVGSVSFDGDSPIFDVTGTVKNNGASTLSRISARIFVYDQSGNLVGAAEASAWDVAAGATASFNGYGLGQRPDGPVKYEVTVLGVKY
ncbi:MAG: FxLYD domain-containing protein [Chloroflexota bacterium]